METADDDDRVISRGQAGEFKRNIGRRDSALRLLYTCEIEMSIGRTRPIRELQRVGASTNTMKQPITDVFILVRDDLECAVRSHARVLVTGGANADTAAIAQWIHNHEPRRSGPLISVDCAAAEILLQSEMPDSDGEPYPADAGTLFLDNIGKMSAHMQAALVKVLDHTPDARIISATDGNLYDEVLAGGFREDLYYRLNIIHIVWPKGSQ